MADSYPETYHGQAEDATLRAELARVTAERDAAIASGAEAELARRTAEEQLRAAVVILGECSFAAATFANQTQGLARESKRPRLMAALESASAFFADCGVTVGGNDETA